MYASRFTTRICFRASSFFLIYISDLATNQKLNVRLFADDTSLFSVVPDLLETTNMVNAYLEKIRSWAEQWRMAFNLDTTKQAEDVVYSKNNFKYLLF